ncbi:unnamed protein product [Rotaria sp. Silwood2]|nr:unnamed protein product [Rotaria sp. Silwood2]CAF4044342.1 unnamed protein product [Rotaria sp. Silwood2]
MNNISLASNNEISQEQQIVYYNAPVNYNPLNSQQPYVYTQQLPHNYTVNQYSSAVSAAQHNQQQPGSSFTSIPPPLMQQSMIHSNMNQQQPVLSVQQPDANVTAPRYSSMINPTVSSTPISAPNKRGRNDTSGLSDSNIQFHPQYHQPTLAFNPNNNTPNKRIRGFNQQGVDGAYFDRRTQNQPTQLNRNPQGTRDREERNNNLQQPSVAASKVEEEFKATRRSIGELKDEMNIRYEETRKQVDILENKMKTMEKKFEDLSTRVYTIMQNICTSMSDPRGAQGVNWQSYWQEQIQTLAECRSSLSMSTE